jgi:hypothetical protein
MHLLMLLFVLSALATLTSGAWVSCANDGQECNLGGDLSGRQVWVKFVADDSTGSVFFRQASDYAHCSSAFFGGDPAPGNTKKCFRHEVEDHVAPSLLTWTRPGEGADYGQEVTQTLRIGAYPEPEQPSVWQAGSMMLVRPGIHVLESGIKDSWSVYGLVGDENAWTEVMCGRTFGVRGDEAHQHCRLSDQPISALAKGNVTWELCGDNGVNCALNNLKVWAGMGYIVRYGRGSAWTYQIVASGNGNLNFDLGCDTTTFRGATAHVENKCWFTPLPFSTFYNNVGSWDLVNANCVPVESTGFAAFKYTTGLQRSVAEANSNTYTETVSESVALLLGKKDVYSATITLGFSQAWAIMEMTTETWTETCTKERWSSIDIGAGGGRCAYIWSWIVSTKEMAGLGLQTQMVARTPYTEGTSSMYNPPPCPPSMMMPPDCTWANCLLGDWPEDRYYAGGCNATYQPCQPNVCIPDYGTPPPTFWETPTPTTASPATATPTTASPATATPTTASPATATPTTASPATATPTTASPATATPTTASPATATPTTASPATASPATATPTNLSLSPTASGPTCCRAINPTVTDAWCSSLGLSSCSAYPDHCQILPCR